MSNSAPENEAPAGPRSGSSRIRLLSSLCNLFSGQSHRGLVARNATWMLLGQGGNFFLQAAYFILLARLLGVRDYGLFAGAFALVSILAPYSALGSGMLFMRYVSADRPVAQTYWGNALLITGCASVLLTVGFYFAGPRMIDVNSGLLFAALALSNCFFTQVTLVASQAFQTLERMSVTAMLSMLANVARLLVLIVMTMVLHHATAMQWAMGALLASAVAAVVALIWVDHEVRGIRFELRLIGKRAWEGLGFSFAGTTTVVYNDVDKAMLSHYGMNRENGFYSLAYRIIDFATTPLGALDAAVLPQYFQLSRKGSRHVVWLAIRCIGISVIAGLAITLAVQLMAPVVPYLVGHQFVGIVAALRWLSWIPLLRGIHRLAGSALTGSGFQNIRTFSQLTVAVTNVALNLWWIPRYGWIGAARSSVISDGLLAVLNVSVLVIVSRNVTLDIHRSEQMADEL